MKTLTFFDWVRRDGQAAVCRALGDGFHAVRIHRAFKAKHGVDEGLVAKCEEILGEAFDRPGTLDEWFQLRRAEAASEAPAEADTAA